ncbi:MAG: hypothetical protein R3290_04215 [Acidimicrobiia bacterium]|nr:hypothetical protein [Acidimicrobiia bacterium]
MSDDRREPRRIDLPDLPEIPDDVARAENMPEDLDSSIVGPYTFPSLTRRRNAGWILLVGAVLAALGATVGPAIGLWATSAGLVVLAAWHFAAAWPLEVSDARALEVANRETDFPVGHASAAVGFDGWRAKPIWNVLVFSADDPPSQRGLVRIDAVDGHVVETYVEANPEVG